jgi:osmotically-inducible protein OsmY
MKRHTDLRQHVEWELDSESRIHSANITAAAKNGIVTLRGHVSSFAEKLMVEDITRRIGGVRAVVDELQVRVAGRAVRTDEEIAQDCVNAFETKFVGALDERVKVVVSNGCVTAYGHVGWQFQKDAALNAIRRLEGIKGVKDRITINPRALPDGTKNKPITLGSKSHRCDITGATV